MDTKEIQRLLIKPAIKQLNGDFKIVNGTFLIKYPIEDIVTGYCFERSSIAENYYLWKFAQPLYELSNFFYLSYGDRIKNKNRVENWSLIDTPNFSKNTIEELIAVLRHNLDFVEEMRSPEKFYSYVENRLKKYENWRFDETRVYTAFWLKKPNARMDAIDLIKYIEKNEDLSFDWIKQCIDSLQVLMDSEDPIAILQKNKKQRIDNLKL